MFSALPFPASVTRRPHIVPVRQAEAAECGLAVLVMIANWHGHAIDLNYMRQRFGVTSRGIGLRQLMQTADAIQLVPRALKLEMAGLDQLDLPAVLHWDLNHFVVLERLDGPRAYIVNPDGIARWYDFAELGNHFSGVALELRPAADFTPIRERQSLRFSDLWGQATGWKRALAQTLVLSLVMQAYILAAPFYLRTAVDEVLPALDSGLLFVLALGFAALALVSSVGTLLRKFVLISSGAALSYGITSNLTRKLFRLPIVWFERRKVGDVLTKFQSILPIQRFLIESAPITIIDGLLSILTLAMMLAVAPGLALITLGGVLAYAALRLVLLREERQRENEYLRALGHEQGAIIETLRGIVTLRLAGRETMRHAYWQNRLTDALGARYLHEKTKAWHETARTLLPALELVAITWLAVRQSMAGAMSLGTLFAYLAYRQQFVQAGQSLCDEGVKFRLLGLHLDQLADIVQTPEDKGFAEPQGQSAFEGRIELRDVTFSYGLQEPEVLSGISLALAPGEHVAITGPSGGGKSTLVKILLGLVDPTGGQVLIDGQPLERFGRRAFRQHVGAVLQDDVLYAGSIADNVASFGEIDPERMERCLRAASILDDIQAMPMRQHTLVGDMGSTLSGGQRQRILLARALYREPSILVMDEGTAHLDLEHEARVNASIAALGITRIVIAHRPDTIAAADRIIHIDRGRIVSDIPNR